MIAREQRRPLSIRTPINSRDIVPENAAAANPLPIWVADSFINILTTFNIQEGLPLAILVSVIGALMTNLMSAGATVAVIGPVVLEMAVSSGTNPIIIGVALAISTSMAFWLVIGTPASSVVYSAGLLDAKDFIRMATFAWPAALVIIICMIIFYWVGLGIQPIMIGG